MTDLSIHTQPASAEAGVGHARLGEPALPVAVAPVAAAPLTSTEYTAPAIRQPYVPPAAATGLSAYNDLESGKLVVQVFDKTHGYVMTEYPSAYALEPYPSPWSKTPVTGQVSVDT
ncbi:MAG: hypothetical protein ACTS3R_15175 [Inquilinaceae bacterium]